MPFTTSRDGTRLYYECQGQGPALLLLAGQSCDHREWERVAVDFSAHFQVIGWDYRGTGQSDKPEEPSYSTRGFAQDAVAVLDACGLARAHAYGISMGGRVAQWLAIDFPERLGALVLGATTPANRVLRARPAWTVPCAATTAKLCWRLRSHPLGWGTTARWWRISPHFGMRHYRRMRGACITKPARHTMPGMR